MSPDTRRALEQDRTIDITTTGRKTGRPHRKEIWFLNVDGRLFITGTPRGRDWYANLVAHPEFTFHLKQSVRADLPAVAKPIVDAPQRREIISKILEDIGGSHDLEAWVAGSPLVEVELVAG